MIFYNSSVFLHELKSSTEEDVSLWERKEREERKRERRREREKKGFIVIKWKIFCKKEKYFCKAATWNTMWLKCIFLYSIFSLSLFPLYDKIERALCILLMQQVLNNHTALLNCKRCRTICWLAMNQSYTNYDEQNTPIARFKL